MSEIAIFVTAILPRRLETHDLHRLASFIKGTFAASDLPICLALHMSRNWAVAVAVEAVTGLEWKHAEKLTRHG